MPELTLNFKNKSVGKYQLQKGLSLTIGRRDDNDIVIDDPAVSGHHAKIDSLGDRFVLIDLKSKNGSFVNEQLIDSHWLKDGDVVAIGGHSLVMDFADDELRPIKRTDEFDETQVMNSTAHRRMMARSKPNKSISAVKFWDKSHSGGSVRGIEPPPLKRKSRTQEASGALTFLDGGYGQVKLTRKITTIGKDRTSDIVIKGLLVDPTSATIRREPDGCYLSYISGLTRPKVNDNPVTGSILLKDSDIIEIGSVRLQFSNEPAPE
ncbi:MAG: FHA domain-containing protein [Desulfobacteraceae bacterium]|jgi:pSer/pThr/pTyr-binding forkhead associated (FHA) protein|nr:FHA domain-containing protein [Desulfobacteraceae bacterium]